MARLVAALFQACRILPGLCCLLAGLAAGLLACCLGLAGTRLALLLPLPGIGLAGQGIETALLGLLGPALPLRQGLALQLFAALLTRFGLGQGGIDLLALLLAAGFGIRNRLACRAAGLFQIFLCIGQQAVGKTIAPVLAGRDGGRFGLLELFKLAGQGVELSCHVARFRLDDTALILTILGQLALIGGFQLGLSARDGGQLLRIPVDDIRIAGRKTQGVVLFRVSDSEKVVSVTRLGDDQEEGANGANGADKPAS